MKKTLGIIGIVLLLVLAGCGQQNQNPPADQNTPTDANEPIGDQNTIDANQPPVVVPDEPPVEPTPNGWMGPEKFVFGIEYGVPDLATAYAETGAHAVKPTPELVLWKNVQARQEDPLDFTVVDDHVKEYQNAGYDYMQLLISAESPWASVDAAKVIKKDTRPKEEFKDDYKAFVEAVVERYDGDGKEDMPGLKYPIMDYGIEREFTGYFPGTGSQYVEVLKMAYPSVKKANPNARVMLNALLMWDIFQGNPDDIEIKKRFENPLNGKRKDLTDAPVILDATDYYDVIDFHSLSDYSEIPATVKWLKKEMEKRKVNKPIFIGDAFPMSPLLAYGFEDCEEGFLNAKPFYPITSETRCKAADVIKDVRFTTGRHKETVEWLRINTAAGLVKKYVVSAGEGVEGINVGNLEDWPIPVGAGLSAYFGLMETKYGGGEQLVATRTVIKKRAGWFALKQVVEKLDGFDTVETISAGTDGVWAYQFTKGGKEVLVAWYDDGEFYQPNFEPPIKNVKFDWADGKAMVTTLAVDETVESSEAVSSNGKLELELGSMPVFVE